MADDFAELDDWLKDYAKALSPAARKRLGLAIGRRLRKSNAERIARNEEPEGGSMVPRKRRSEKRKDARTKRGRMFRKIRLIRNLKVRADAEGVEVGFANPMVERTAAIHHFGEVGYVGKTRDGRTIRTRYEARRLLGFGADDRKAIMDAAIDHIAR